MIAKKFAKILFMTNKSKIGTQFLILSIFFLINKTFNQFFRFSARFLFITHFVNDFVYNLTALPYLRIRQHHQVLELSHILCFEMCVKFLIPALKIIVLLLFLFVTYFFYSSTQLTIKRFNVFQKVF